MRNSLWIISNPNYVLDWYMPNFNLNKTETVVLHSTITKYPTLPMQKLWIFVFSLLTTHYCYCFYIICCTMCNDSYTYSTLPLLFIIKNCVKYIVFVFERLLLSLDLVSCNQNALRVVLVFNCINIRYYRNFFTWKI